MLFGAIMAGGSGSRMKSDIPKQFIELSGRPVIAYSLKLFIECDKIDAIFIGVHPDWMEYCENIIGEHFPEHKSRIHVTPGGGDRNATLMNVIAAIEEKFGDGDDNYIITHDAARPMITKEILEAHINALTEHDAVNTVVPVTDTIITSEDGLNTDSALKRDELYRVQTPQSFRINSLKEQYAKLNAEQKAALTDACGIFTVNGAPVHLVRGSVANIKLTTPEDMAIAEVLINRSKGNDRKLDESGRNIV